VTTVVSATWKLTAGGVSGVGLLTEPSCLDTESIDPETGTEIGEVLCPSILATAVTAA